MSVAFEARPVRVAAVALAGIKLWLVSAQPVFAIGQSPHDDRLFLRLANLFLDGQWLGPYTQLTLAKGPAFPVFIAGTVATGIPLPLAQHLFYLLACWLVVRALRPLLRSDFWAFGLFALLLWQPMSYEMPALGRVLRQNIYTPCTLLAFAGLAALHTRASASFGIRAVWAALLGMALGAVWLTREESIWIMPATAMLGGIAVFLGRRQRLSWARAAAPVAVAGAFALAPVVLVCALNARHYGWWGTVEFRAPQFLAAYGAMNRVNVGPEIPRVPLTRAGREVLYEASPAFTELRPWLEGAVGDGAALHSVTAIGPDAAPREIAGGWWMWALRDAVAAAGHAHSAAEALAFYQRLADEVNAACDRGDVPAGPRRVSMLPPWRTEYTAGVFRKLPSFLGAVAAFSGFNAHAPPSIGDAESLRLFRDLTQWHLSPAPDAPEFDTPTATIARGYRVQILHVAGHALRWLCTLVVGVGLFAWVAVLVQAVRRQTVPAYPWWYASACLGTVLAIVLINLLVDVTSFPQFGPHAFAQAYPLVLVFAGLSAAGLFRGEGEPPTRTTD